MDRKTIAFAAFLLFLAAYFIAQPIGALAAQDDKADKPKEEKLVKIEAKYVCMINNHKFNKAQVAVKVEDRTYYGCCEMCQKRLQEDAESRVATDPVSGKKVDKATAIIGANSDGEVFYFENEENLNKFSPSSDSVHSKHH